MKTSLRSFLIVGLIFFAAWSLNVRLQWRSEPLIEAIGAWSQGKVWIEFVQFNGNEGGPGGFAGHFGVSSDSKDLGYSDSGGSASNRPFPVPNRAVFQWFNFRQQRYYEAVIDDPEMPLRAKKFALSQRDWRRFKFSLVYDFAANGNVRLWLYGIDYKIAAWDKGDSDCHTLLSSAQGYEIEGNPQKFKQYTSSLLREGRIPGEPDPAPAATQPRRKSVIRHFLREKEVLHGKRT